MNPKELEGARGVGTLVVKFVKYRLEPTPGALKLVWLKTLKRSAWNRRDALSFTTVIFRAERSARHWNGPRNVLRLVLPTDVSTVSHTWAPLATVLVQQPINVWVFLLRVVVVASAAS